MVWTYEATLAGQQSLNNGNSRVTTRSLPREDSGREKNVSTLTLLSVSGTDGGLIKCTAGDRISTARLTVLGTFKFANVIFQYIIILHLLLNFNI